MRQPITVMLTVLTIFIVATPALAADAASARGEIVEIRNGVAVQNRGEFDQLTIRTRNGETQQLLLGPSGSCPGCVMLGDRVRAQLMGDDTGTARRVQAMKVRRTGETLRFRNEAGELIGERTQMRTGPGTSSANGQRAQRHERLHQSSGAYGTGGGNGGRARSCGGGRR